MHLFSTCYEFFSSERLYYTLGRILNVKPKWTHEVNATEYSVVCCVFFYEFMTFEFYNKTLKTNFPIHRNIKIIDILKKKEVFLHNQALFPVGMFKQLREHLLFMGRETFVLPKKVLCIKLRGSTVTPCGQSFSHSDTFTETHFLLFCLLWFLHARNNFKANLV